MSTPVRLAWTILLLLLLAPSAGAQGHDSQGKEFWVAFLENFGSGGYTEESDLRLYASCPFPTTIRLMYHATGEEIELPIAEANRPIEIDISRLFGNVEIAGGEEVTSKSISVHAEREITLYGVNVRRMSSDAFLALPADVFTRRYIVLAYQNGVMGDAQGFSEIDMPSQFCVIATEDGTTLRVTPSAPIVGRGKPPFTVGLDRGEVYFAQAQLDEEWDLSGTVIQSTKPVAVFAGNRRTAIPADVGNFRDHLVEQMPPIEVWGREAIVTPHFPITPQSREIAVVRVLAATDDTQWRIDGVRQAPLMRARAVEVPLTTAMHIVANRPIIVAQYEHSVNASEPLSDDFELGDPFMMLVPPPEQFDTAYSFQSVGHPEFLRHFVNIVIPSEGLPSLRLDDYKVEGNFVPIAGTRYGYVQYEVDAGAHYISSDSAFGLFAYGYGRANSYGYTGGMAYRRFVHDFEPPDIEQALECGRLTGVLVDDRITDSGIDSCYALEDSRNVRITIEPFERAADTVRFSAESVDPYRDGVAAIRAIDSGGRSRTQITPIPGFTVRVPSSTDGGAYAIDTISIFNGVERCGTFDIVNDGLFEQVITTVRFAQPIASIRLATELPVRLRPGERRTLEYCAASLLDTILSTQVVVGSDCLERPVGLLTISSGPDTTGPERRVSRGPCAEELELRFQETGRKASGIIEIGFTELVNCRVDWVAPDTIAGPVAEIACRLTALDRRRDAFIAGSVVDLAGNRVAFHDTIGGFTCAVVEAGDTLSVTTGRSWSAERLAYNEYRCDTLTVVNYGTQPVRISAALLDRNTIMSIPPSQAPLVIPPGGRRRLTLCIESFAIGELLDTLTLADDCGRLDRIALNVRVPSLLATGADRCNSALSIHAVGATKRTFLRTPVPNPSSGGIVTIDVGLAAAADVSLELFDTDGRPAHAVLRREPLTAGIHRITADLASLGSGRYLLRLATGREELVEAVVVVR